MAKRASTAEVTSPAGPVHPITLLSQVIGQKHAKGVLEGVLASGRVHHAWIFHGPAGVGKFTTAYAFAAALLDPTLGRDLAGHLTPEEGSQVQRLAAAGTHPDLHVITKELAAVSSDPKIRDSKQITLAKGVVDEFLLEPAGKTRVMGGEGSLAGKVFIVDEAEMMDQRTQNVLLKTIEEPAAGSVIILVTSSEDRLLPTVRSRCQRVGFVPLDDAEMQAWLAGRGAEKVSPWLLRFAGGSPGTAEMAVANNLEQWQEVLGGMLDQVWSGSFAVELGGTMSKLVGERAEAVVKANPEASKDAANKAWARRMLAFIADDARQRLRTRVAKGMSGDEAREDAVVEQAMRVLEAATQAEAFLAANVNMGLMFEELGAEMAR